MRAKQINESYIEKIFMVESKEHTVSINNKPVYNIECTFFLDKNEAQDYAKKEKLKFNNSKLNKVSTRAVDKSIFDWFTINKHKTIANGVHKNFYLLRGTINRINPTYGEKIFIEQTFSIEEGQIISDFLNR